MVEQTLQAMRLGGIYDQIGFGFHRYSTDERWLLRIEKMLSIRRCCQWRNLEHTGDRKESVRSTRPERFLPYVLRDMTRLTAVFYSAQDADSEGAEGKFYVWLSKEIQELFDEAKQM
jgi:uncharacterized protein YyaL (SSP411 family)